MHMSKKERNILYLIGGFLLFLVGTWMSSIADGPAISQEDHLRDREHFTDSQDQERENDLHLPRRQILYNMTSSTGDLQLPTIFHLLPHLAGHPDALSPAYKLAPKGKVGASVVLGIPTIKRENATYLLDTLTSLLTSLTPEEQEQTIIVILVAEPYDTQFAIKVGNSVKEGFPNAVNSGLIEVISSPAAFYPDMDKLRLTLGDSKERVKWRTKQNLDYCFLMMYCHNKGTYYVQLEDDIITKPNFVTIMKNFALNQKMEDWILLEFSNLGFIGKLFKSADLPKIIQFFLIFYNDKPIDWLLSHLLVVKVCNPEKDNTDCSRMVAQYRIKYKPSLFQHVGIHSSLKGKVQKMKDKDFGTVATHKAHNNPPAEVSTTLEVYQQNTIEKAYRGDTFFWALKPKPGDIILFTFVPAIQIERFYFKSGNGEHPGDKFYNTTVEVQLKKQAEKAGGIVGNKSNIEGYPITQDGFLVVGNFTLGVAQGFIKKGVGLIEKCRIKVHSSAENWVILSDIFIKPRTGKLR